jgi:TonB-linked SusC/RagA family outer membrane protein
MMIILRRLLVLPLLAAVGISEAAAQQTQTVTGRVVSAETLAPLVGVGVVVEGTNTAAVTGSDGRYSIQAPSTGTLIFNMLGFSDVREAIQGRPVINVTLSPAAIALDELVVVGYGAQSRATVSGSVSSVSSEELSTTTHTNTAAALAGAVQGISVRMTTNGNVGLATSGGSGLASQVAGDPVDGRPGSSAVLQIRNMGDPLFVIDGVPSDGNAFNTLSPNDIDNISILKDASAAVYGFRAANGVVLVTTKRGTREQAPQISISGAYGLQNLTRYHYQNMYNAYEHLWNQADSQSNLGLSNNLSEAQREEGRAFLERWRQGGPGYESVDYYDLAILSNRPQWNAAASVRGGTQSAQYYLSLGHVQQDYNMRDFTWGRSNLSANLSVDLSNSFRIGTELRALNGVTDGVAIAGDTDPIRHLLFTVNTSWPEQQPMIGPNKEYINYNVRRLDRTVGMLSRDVSGWTKDLRREASGNFWAQYTFPFGTTVRATYSASVDLRDYDLARKAWDAYCYDEATDTYNVCWNSGDRTRQHLNNRVDGQFANVTVSHSQSFGGHSLSGTAFSEIDGSETRRYVLVGQLPTNYTHILEQARVTGVENSWDISRRASVGGRVDYDFDQKYLATFLARYDGSYLYAPGKRWGFFPGISLGWRISEEPFFKNSIGFLDDLKLRASWGQTGREQGINSWGFLSGATYNQGNGSIFEEGYIAGSRPRDLPITNLTWVTSTMRNIGFDALLLDSKMSLEVDLFERALSGLPAGRNDLLLPDEVGYDLPNENLNKDVMRGFEFAMTYNDQVGRVSYSVSPNFTIARSRPEYRQGQRYGSSWDQYRNGIGGNTAIGRWSGVSFGYKAIGQFQTVEEIENYPVVQDGQDNRNLLPGDLIFEDVNKDGIINNMDQRPIGFETGITPIVSYGANTRISWSGITLTAQFAGGAYFSHLRDWEMRYQGWGDHNGPAYGMDRWRRVDPYDQQSAWIPGKYPPLRVNRTGSVYPSFNNASTFWRTNVKFLKVRNVELSYDVPDRIPASFGLSRVRVFTNLTNPLSIDNTRHYSMDPEVVQVNGQVYPSIRLLNFGFSANIGGAPRSDVAVPVSPAGND